MRSRFFSSVTLLFLALVPLCFLSFLPPPSLAVGGLSNTKVVLPSAETVPRGHFEFDPVFGLFLADDDADTKEFDAGVRLTLGASESAELGVSVSFLTVEDSRGMGREEDFGNTDAGVKYRFLDQDGALPFSLAYQGGVTLPTGGDDAPFVVEPAGLILTKDFSERFSADSDAVLGFVEDEGYTLVAEAGFGYFILASLQLVLEAGYFFEDPYEGASSHIFNVTGGFTMPLGESFTLIVGVTGRVVDENTDGQLALTAAFTFLF